MESAEGLSSLFRSCVAYHFPHLIHFDDATGGGGGKGTWGKVLTADNDLELDRNDPNYDSEEVQFTPLQFPYWE